MNSGTARHCFQAGAPQCALCMFDESLFASDCHAFSACELVDYCISQSTKSNILSWQRIWINTFRKPTFGYSVYIHVEVLKGLASMLVLFLSVYVWFVGYLQVWIVSVQRKIFFNQRVLFLAAIFSHTLYIKVYLGFYFFLRQTLVYKLNNF